MTKRNFSMIGMVVALIVAFCGILTLCGVMGGDTGHPSSASYLYDSGYASFGADFYSYVCNNAAEAADGAQKAASNLNEIAKLLKNIFGIIMIGFGLIAFCVFGMIWAGTEKPEKTKNVATESAVSEDKTDADEDGETQDEIEIEVSETDEVTIEKSEE